jgi:hypothetical protein
VQRDVDEVIAEHGIAPYAMFQPEGAVEERIILLRGAEIEPDAPETVQGTKIGAGHVHVVVPGQAAVEGGQAGGNGDAHQ